MRRNHLWIAAIGLVALLAFIPIISSGTPRTGRSSKEPSAKERVIYSFQGTPDGANPVSDLILSAGRLYGTTAGGGPSGYGTVFELQRTNQGWAEKVLYAFTGGNDGAQPVGGLVFDSSGNLYGTASTKGSNGGGTAFKLTPNARGEWTFQLIYAFAASTSDAASPQADLILDAKDDLFGTTLLGGQGSCSNYLSCGTVFELSPDGHGSWTETILHTFQGPEGGSPSSPLVLDSAGNLYGMAEEGGSGTCFRGHQKGCGVIYQLSANGKGWTYSVLFNFTRGRGGNYPAGGLLLNQRGDLFGATQLGGDEWGTVFGLHSLGQKGWQEGVLHIFSGPPEDGSTPVGKLVQLGDTLYGVTSAGSAPSGTVFRLVQSSNSWHEKVVHGFSGPPDGSSPQSGVVRDPRGHLYGTTEFGGTGNCSKGCGVVYEITP